MKKHKGNINFKVDEENIKPMFKKMIDTEEKVNEYLNRLIKNDLTEEPVTEN